MVKLKVKKLNNDAVMPSYTREADACMDICSCEDVLIKNGTTHLVKTGLVFEVPKGWVAHFHARSGLGARGVRLANCTAILDENYRGEFLVALRNESGEDFEVKKGMRIAQFGLFRANRICIEEVETLSDTERGAGGFGSSGLY